MTKPDHLFPPQPHSVRKNFSFSVAGNVIYSLCQWGLLISLTRFASMSSLGLFGLGTALSTPFYAFFSLRIRQYLITDVRSEYSVQQYFQIRLVSSTIALLLIFLVALAYSDNSMMPSVIVLVGITKYIETFNDIYQAVFQRHERLDYAAASNIASGLFSLTIFGTALLYTNNILVALVGLIVSKLSILSLTSYIANTRFHECNFFTVMKAPVDFSMIWKFAQKAAPLGLMTLLVSLNTNVARYILEHFHGIKSLGIYTATSYFMYAGTTICSALLQSVATPLAKKYQNIGYGFYKLFFKMLFFAVSVGIIGILVSHWGGEFILTRIYGKDFAGQSRILTIFMTSAALMYVYGYLSIILTTMRFLKAQGTLSVISLTITTISAYALIPQSSTMGAAYSSLIGSAVYFIGASVMVCYGFLRKTTHNNND